MTHATKTSGCIDAKKDFAHFFADNYFLSFENIKMYTLHDLYLSFVHDLAIYFLRHFLSNELDT